MKRILIVLVCWVFFQSVFAQDTPSKPATGENDMNILFGNKGNAPKIPIGYFLDIDGGFTKFSRYGVFLPGMSLGIILNHHWTIGLTGNIIDNTKGLVVHNIYYDSISKNMRGADLNGGFGGILLEYSLFPKSRIHFTFPIMIGDGYLFYTQLPEYYGSAQPYHYKHHAYISINNCFVIEPGVRLDFNFVRIFRLGLAITYRYSPDLALLNTSTHFIDQFTGKIILRFGQF